MQPNLARDKHWWTTLPPFVVAEDCASDLPHRWSTRRPSGFCIRSMFPSLTLIFISSCFSALVKGGDRGDLPDEVGGLSETAVCHNRSFPRCPIPSASEDDEKSPSSCGPLCSRRKGYASFFFPKSRLFGRTTGIFSEAGQIVTWISIYSELIQSACPSRGNDTCIRTHRK